MSGVKKTNIFKRFLSYTELLKKYNTLKNNYETLLEITKNDLLDKLMKNSDTELQNIKLKKENKHLREKVKTLKEIIRNDKETK